MRAGDDADTLAARVLEQALEEMKTPKELVYHIGKELLLNHKDIFSKVEAAVSDGDGTRILLQCQLCIN